VVVGVAVAVVGGGEAGLVHDDACEVLRTACEAGVATDDSVGDGVGAKRTEDFEAVDI